MLNARLVRRVWDSPTMMTWASLGTNMARFVLVLPLVLRNFSPEDVAIWYLIGTLIAFQSFLDFGFGATASRYYAYAMGGATDLREPHRGRTEGANAALIARLYRAFRALFVPLGCAALLVMALAGSLFLAKPIGLSPDPAAAWTAWMVVLATSGIAFCSSGYAVLLEGSNRVALLRRLDAGVNVMSILTMTSVLLLDGGLVALAVASQSWLLLGILGRRWLALRALSPGAAHGPLFAMDREILGVIWQSAWRSGVGILLNTGVVRLTAGWLAQVTPAAELAAYLIAFNLLDRLNQFAMAPFYSKLPAMGAHYSRGEADALRSAAMRGALLTLGTFVVAATAIGLAAEPLLGMIGSQTPFIGLPFWFLLAAAFVVHRLGAIHLQLYTLSNHVVLHIADGIAGAIYVAGLVALTPLVGIYSVPLSLLLAYGGFYTPYAVGKARTWYARWRGSLAAGSA